jgi:hypothetical protein
VADIIDQAQEQEAINIVQSLQRHATRARTINKPKAMGYCLNHECAEPFDTQTERLFCGPSCAEKFEVIQKKKYQ